MLCASLVAMGSDLCRQSEGFKKVYIYNLKKYLPCIETTSLFLCLPLCTELHRVCMSVCMMHRRCGLQCHLSISPSHLTEEGPRAWLAGHLRAMVNLSKIFLPLLDSNSSPFPFWEIPLTQCFKVSSWAMRGSGGGVWEWPLFLFQLETASETWARRILS